LVIFWNERECRWFPVIRIPKQIERVEVHWCRSRLHKGLVLLLEVIVGSTAAAARDNTHSDANVTVPKKLLSGRHVWI
jgi:hypothetical protein